METVEISPVYLDPPNMINLSEIIYLANQTSSSHEYEFQKFDCTEFSEELAGKLKEKGYKAYCVYGIYRPGKYPYHTWVEIDLGAVFLEVESTGGFIIGDEDYELNYKQLIKGKCI